MILCFLVVADIYSRNQTLGAQLEGCLGAYYWVPVADDAFKKYKSDWLIAFDAAANKTDKKHYEKLNAGNYSGGWYEEAVYAVKKTSNENKN